MSDDEQRKQEAEDDYIFTALQGGQPQNPCNNCGRKDKSEMDDAFCDDCLDDLETKMQRE